MKVFVSSVMTGFEAERDAAMAAIRTLGHVPIRAEDFSANPQSPRSACLAGVREADAVLLVMGSRYGELQSSGKSATHEEYLEAQGSRPVLLFVQEGAKEAKQEDFVREVQGWEKGHFTAAFVDAADLRDKVTRALHDYTLATESTPLDPEALVSHAMGLLDFRDRGSSATLTLALAPGPTRAVLRPAELEAASLSRAILAEALTGDHSVLTPSAGTDVSVTGDRLVLEQRDSSRFVSLDELGQIVVRRPVMEDSRGRGGLPSIIEEDVVEMVERSLRFAAAVLEHVDPIRRLTHVALVARISGGSYLSWRTRAEQLASPNRMSMGSSNSDHTVQLSPPVRRLPALVHEARVMAEDLTVRLRRGAER